MVISSFENKKWSENMPEVIPEGLKLMPPDPHAP